MRQGERVAVLSIGHIGNNVIKALDRLENEGVKVGHYDMIFVKPIDEEILSEAASRYDHIVTVEDGTIVGGLGSAVAEWPACHNCHASLTRLGIPDNFVDQGTVAQLQQLCGIDPDSIYNTILKIVQ